MIHNEQEYKQAVKRVEDERARITEQERTLREMGLVDAEVKRAMDPVCSFRAQLEEEIEAYERLCRGEFQDLHNLGGLGHLLVRLRIAQKMTQAQLAELLGVDPSQVSRDERNEYRGITLERANKVLEALGAELETRVVELSKSRSAA